MNTRSYLITLLELASGDIEENDPQTADKRIRAAIRILRSDDVENEIFDIAAELEGSPA